MDWLKRNWVDVLMGGLIVSIAAGVLVVLLRGGLFVSSNTNTPPNEPLPATAPTNTPPTPVTSPTPSPTPSTTTPVPAPTTPAPTPAPAQPSQADKPKPQADKPKPTVAPKPTASLSVPDIPQAPSPKPTASNKTAPVASQIQTAQAIKPTQAIKPVVTKPIQTKPIQTKPIQTSSQKPAPVTRPSPNAATKGTYTRADFLRNYRVAAGSYTSLERAIRAASLLRSRDLPAQHFSSGNTYVVVVGPYAREASARSALTKVRQTQPDAILYRPDGSREGVAAKTPSPPSPKQGGGGGSSPATFTVAYLQVGAFKDSQSAATLLDKLKNAGFAPLTKNIAGLLRVLVGPLQSNQIESTRTTLKNQGFDAFPINL
jgi:cell division septation protein DedD